MAPVDGGGKRLLARQRRAGAAGEKPEAIVTLRSDSRDRELAATCRGKLDRQRDPVQTVTDLGDGRRVDSPELECRSGAAGPVDEQLHRRES